MGTYHIWVECTSRERFDVRARSFEEARERYERGECSLRVDEVICRDEHSIENEAGELREFEEL